MRRRRLNLPLMFTLIASGITIICALFGLIYLSQYKNFFNYYESTMVIDAYQDRSIEDIIMSILPSLTSANIRTFMYIYNIFSGILAILLCVPSIVFSILCFKDNENTVEEFQSRNKLHIWLLVSIGLAYIGNNSELGSVVYDALSIFSLVAVVFLIIAFIQILRTMRYNSYAFKLAEARKTQEEKKGQERYTFKEASFEPTNEGNQIGEENLEKPVIQEEIKVDQSKLDQMYELLSKLEKSYKANEITFEDYERMKKTILDNYLRQD